MTLYSYSLSVCKVDTCMALWHINNMIVHSYNAVAKLTNSVLNVMTMLVP